MNVPGHPLLRAAVVTGSLIVSSTARSEPTACSFAEISVMASEPVVTDLVCRAAERAAQQLASCGLPLHDPVVVRVRDDFAASHSKCAARFDCQSMSIDVASPATLYDVIGAGSLWAGLDTVDYFESVVAHELTHAAFQQAVGDRVVDPADHEYVAYAMQMQFLSEADRRSFLSAVDVVGPVETTELNAIVALMVPGVFAARVWHHFNGPEGGCDFVDALARGERTLALGE